MSGATGPVVLNREQARRLRAYYRSAGWPCLDALEIELLHAGLIARVPAAGGSETIRLTELGLAAVAASLTRNRRAFDAHEALVARLAASLAADGRLVYRGLMLRGRIAGGWKPCRPDVYSIRYTSVAAYARPAIHEIKVRRADLLADLKNADKRAAYQALSAEFYYVMPDGLAVADEIPQDCGLLLATPTGFRLARPSPRRAVQPGVGEWMSLARRGAEFLDADHPQAPLDESR